MPPVAASGSGMMAAIFGSDVELIGGGAGAPAAAGAGGGLGALLALGTLGGGGGSEESPRERFGVLPDTFLKLFVFDIICNLCVCVVFFFHGLSLSLFFPFHF